MNLVILNRIVQNICYGKCLVRNLKRNILSFCSKAALHKKQEQFCLIV
nr:MAG TPA: hypothetical protein [Caudoviricetes sp.]